MVFDPGKDRAAKVEEVEADKAGQKIEVKLVSYDGGPLKVQLARFDETNGARKYLKLGRMSINEASDVCKVLSEILDHSQA